MSLNESNTVEPTILDAVTKRGDRGLPLVAKTPAPGRVASLGGELHPARWDYVPALQIPLQSGDVMVEQLVREPLIRFNPEVAGQSDRVYEIIQNNSLVFSHSLPTV